MKRMVVYLTLCGLVFLVGCSKTETNNSEKEKVDVKKSIEEQAVEANQEEPAKVGEWVATKDGYIRIDKVVRGEEADKVVEKYNNAESTLSKFTELEDELEYGVLEYSVYYPDTSKEKEVYPNVVLLTDGVGEDTYENRGYHYINTVYNITWYDEDKSGVPVGEVYKGCRAIFTTVEDMSKISIATDYIADKVTQTSYIEVD